MCLRIEEQKLRGVKTNPNHVTDSNGRLIRYLGGDYHGCEVDIDDLHTIGNAGLEMADPPSHCAAVERRGQAHMLGADAEEHLLSVRQGVPADLGGIWR